MPPQTRRHRIATLDAKLSLKRRELAEVTCPDDLATVREAIDQLLDERLSLQPAILQ
jgi:hypothetical protein